MLHKHHRILVVGLVLVGMSSLHCKATTGSQNAPRSPRKQTDTNKLARRVIMLPVSVIGAPSLGDMNADPEIRIYAAASATAQAVVPTAIDIVYPAGDDKGRPANGDADILNVTIPVTLFGEPQYGEAVHMREIQLFFAGDEARPRIPTEVRIVYAEGKRPTLATLGLESSTAAAKTCAMHVINGVPSCYGECPLGECLMVTRTLPDGRQRSTCECVTIHAD